VIVDSSALVAIVKEEPDELRMRTAIGSAEIRRISAVSYVEAAIIVDRERDPVIARRFDELLARAQLQIAPVTEAQAKIARAAYRDFGKGSGHSAKLNLGDCFSYALAKEMGEPLLFKGNDFVHTDVEAA
jgi:ribonuclease VapC